MPLELAVGARLALRLGVAPTEAELEKEPSSEGELVVVPDSVRVSEGEGAAESEGEMVAAAVPLGETPGVSERVLVPLSVAVPLAVPLALALGVGVGACATTRTCPPESPTYSVSAPARELPGASARP